MCENSSSSLTAEKSRYGGSKIIFPVRPSTIPLWRGIPNFSGKSVFIFAITFKLSFTAHSSVLCGSDTCVPEDDAELSAEDTPDDACCSEEEATDDASAEETAEELATAELDTSDDDTEGFLDTTDEVCLSFSVFLKYAEPFFTTSSLSVKSFFSRFL